MDANSSKLSAGATGEITDSGFSEDAKEIESYPWQRCLPQPLYVRSPSYERNEVDGNACNEAQSLLREQDEDGNTILHQAIFNGNEHYACKIIDVVDKETLEIKNNLGFAPLILAVEENMLQAAESLVDASVDVTGINYQTMDNVLHISAKNTNAPMLRMFQEKSNPDVLVKLVNKVNETGQTPFHIAASKMNLICCQLLVDIGADVNSKDHQNGYTSLHYVSLRQDAEFLSAFISAFKPDLDVTSYAGETPYVLACENGFKLVKNTLVQAGCSVEPDYFQD